jgi:acetyl esterase/lipase
MPRNHLQLACFSSPARALLFGLVVAFAYPDPVFADRPDRTRSKNTSSVHQVQNVSYSDNPKVASNSQKLDLFLPTNKKDFPVVVFVHGGSWMYGDKDFSGWGTAIGRFFASQGIGAVMPNYRLSPFVRHPEHIKDVAKAFAWTARNIQKYGGSPDRLFLCGHSAGAHLVSLLATNDAYLKAEGLKPSAIKGVIAVSGVYRVFSLGVRLKITGETVTVSLGPLVDLKVAEPVKPAKKPRMGEPATQMEVRLDLLGLVFGFNPQVRKEASPLSHVKPGLPPFLIVSPSGDLPGLPELAAEFAAALRKAKCEVEVLKIKGRDHDSVMFAATRAADPLARAIERFVTERIKTALKTAGKN